MDIEIVQISTAVMTSGTGTQRVVIYGLGKDNKVYFWRGGEWRSSK